MSDRKFWKCLSIQEFLSQSNWEGNPLKQPLEPTFSEVSWLCLTVGEFLRHGNWQGKAIVKGSRNQQKVTISLTMPVSEFFAAFVWESSSEIAAVPPVKSPPLPAPSGDRDMKLTDLFDLF